MVFSHLHGILNVRKPAGWTSHDVVLRLRRILHIRKVGHAGTLDPAATGVLPVLLGKGTKIADHLLSWEKEYIAVLRLGQSTDTQDATGTVIQETPTEALSEDQIQSTVEEFRGDIQQTPPMYSAVKVNGQPLYKAARRGETIPRSSRPVTIYQLEVLAIRGRDVDLRVICSKGTYIRTLCSDIGDRLQVGGHLHWLERRRVGPLHVQDAIDIEDLTEESFSSEMSRVFRTIDEALTSMPVVMVNPEHVKKVINGAPIPWREVSMGQGDQDVQIGEGQYVRIRGPQGQLLAIGTFSASALSATGDKMRRLCVENVCFE